MASFCTIEKDDLLGDGAMRNLLPEAHMEQRIHIAFLSHLPFLTDDKDRTDRKAAEIVRWHDRYADVSAEKAADVYVDEDLCFSYRMDTSSGNQYHFVRILMIVKSAGPTALICQSLQDLDVMPLRAVSLVTELFERGLICSFSIMNWDLHYFDPPSWYKDAGKMKDYYWNRDGRNPSSQKGGFRILDDQLEIAKRLRGADPPVCWETIARCTYTECSAIKHACIDRLSGDKTAGNKGRSKLTDKEAVFVKEAWVELLEDFEIEHDIEIIPDTGIKERFSRLLADSH